MRVPYPLQPFEDVYKRQFLTNAERSSNRINDRQDELELVDAALLRVNLSLIHISCRSTLRTCRLSWARRTRGLAATKRLCPWAVRQMRRFWASIAAAATRSLSLIQILVSITWRSFCWL